MDILARNMHHAKDHLRIDTAQPRVRLEGGRRRPVTPAQHAGGARFTAAFESLTSEYRFYPCLVSERSVGLEMVRPDEQAGPSFYSSLGDPAALRLCGFLVVHQSEVSPITPTKMVDPM
jgi:hypothetical protein